MASNTEDLEVIANYKRKNIMSLLKSNSTTTNYNISSSSASKDDADSKMGTSRYVPPY